MDLVAEEEGEVGEVEGLVDEVEVIGEVEEEDLVDEEVCLTFRSIYHKVLTDLFLSFSL